MTIQTEQESPKHRGANGLHGDVVALKVDVATLKEQGKNFATKEDIAKLETKIAEARAEIKEDINQLLEAINRAAVRVIVALVGVIVALGGILVTLILK